MSKWAWALGAHAAVGMRGILWGSGRHGGAAHWPSLPSEPNKAAPTQGRYIPQTKKRSGRREAAGARVEALKTDSRQSVYLQNQVMCAR